MSEKGKGKAAEKEEQPLYDPSQSATERRQIRHSYRLLRQRLQVERDDLIEPSDKGLVDVLNKANELYKEVHHTREVACDSTVLREAAHLGTLKAQKLQTTFLTFDPIVFSEKLRSFMLTETDEVADLAWDRLGRAGSQYCRLPPAVDFMFGPLDMDTTKKVRQMKKREKDPDAEVTKVKNNLDAHLKKKPQEATGERVQEVYTVLCDLRKQEKARLKAEGATGPPSVGFYDLVINPHDFGQTVENIFHFAFLVKDNRATLYVDGGEPRVETMSAKDVNKAKKDVARDNVQMVMEMTIPQWRRLTEAFQITKSAIPSRIYKENGEVERVEGGTAAGKRKAPAAVEAVEKRRRKD